MPFFFPSQEFNPLLAFAEELNKATQPQKRAAPCTAPCARKPTRTFAPRFDVKETEETYELYGDLPGVEQSNINIEWNEDNVLTIAGHSERHAEFKSPDAETTEKTTTTNTADEDGDIDIVNNDDAASEHSSTYHSPTVEDEDAPATTTTTVDTKSKQPVAEHKEEQQPQQPFHRYWVSERSYGSFSRSFQFPSRVEQEAVKATFKNGVLNISVPKAKAREPRRIVIQ